MAGAAVATAQRMVLGTPAGVLAALNQTMQRDESLILKRRHADRVTWEPRRDFWAALRRLSLSSGRAYDLLRVSEVAATAIAVDDSRTLIRLDADVSGIRGRRLQGGVAVATAGTVAGGIVFGLAMLIQPVLMAALAVGAVPALAGVAGGVAVARTHRQILQRAQLALEQVLDRIEHNEARRPPSLLDVLVR
jgi:tetrahydromethanopterin S-methyltransferase subunit F